MYILGLATMNNSAAAIFHNGVLIAAIENERLSRIKNDGAFPILAINECLRISNLNIKDISEIAVYWKPWKVGVRTSAVLKKMISSNFSNLSLLKRAIKVILPSAQNKNDASNWLDLFFVKTILKKEFGHFNSLISFHDHHLSHQLYAEAMCDWNQFLSLSYDGGGEEFSSVLTAVNNGVRTNISCHKWPNSLGHFYSTFTGFLGFKMLEGEYKMMGLAPYGNARFVDLILENILILKKNGTYELNTDICDYHLALQGKFNKRMIAMFGPKRKSEDKPSKNHIDLASSVQYVFELAQQNLFKSIDNSKYSYKKLVLSGGCALNVTANGKLLDKKIFHEVIIPPAPHDAGCAIGACIALLHSKKIPIDTNKIRNPYLGSNYTNLEIEKEIKLFCNNQVKKVNSVVLTKKVASLLSQGLIVAWVQGRSEFGPRALGGRSFLADPRKDEIREEINKKIKKRELFRPFAPSVLENDVNEFFEFDQKSPYMNIVGKVRSKFKDKIPAVTHIDGTARVHTVSKEANPIYYQLLEEFKKISGIPILLNTSFNIQEPIVETPQQAFQSFKLSGVDCLVVGQYLILRKDLK
jgi:carbamoyltransferase